MTAQEMNAEFAKRERELRAAGMAGEFDGPVGKKFEDDLLAMVEKELALLQKESRHVVSLSNISCLAQKGGSD